MKAYKPGEICEYGDRGKGCLELHLLCRACTRNKQDLKALFVGMFTDMSEETTVGKATVQVALYVAQFLLMETGAQLRIFVNSTNKLAIEVEIENRNLTLIVAMASCLFVLTEKDKVRRAGWWAVSERNVDIARLTQWLRGEVKLTEETALTNYEYQALVEKYDAVQQRVSLEETVDPILAPLYSAIADYERWRYHDPADDTGISPCSTRVRVDAIKQHDSRIFELYLTVGEESQRFRARTDCDCLWTESRYDQIVGCDDNLNKALLALCDKVQRGEPVNFPCVVREAATWST